MNAWMTFWSVLLWGSMAVFAVIVVLVAVGGLKDILAMFRALAREHAEEAERHGSPPPPPPDASSE